jgi:hypothetical protein
MIGNGIFILIALALIFTIFWYNIKKNKLNTKKDDKKVDFFEIMSFDKDEYIKEVFNSVFYSIQFEDWEKEISYTKISFSKKNPGNGFRDEKISIEFRYHFEEKIFTINDTKLIDDKSFNTFNYKNKLPIDIKKFLYEIYSNWVNERNFKEKEGIDKSLKNIKNILGKASERGSKLDKLLGN